MRLASYAVSLLEGIKLYQTRILGIGSYHPEKRLTNLELEKMVETSDSWITERTGIKERRVSDPNRQEFPTDLAMKAAQKAMREAKCQPDEIELIIYASNTPELLLPNSACELQQKLGIKNQCPAFDLVAACSGFVYGLTLANSLIATGTYQKILVVGTEMLSSLVNWKDRATCILFGDGAGVAVVGRAGPSEKSRIFSTHLGAEGAGKESLWIPKGGCKEPLTKDNVEDPGRYITMVGGDIFKWAVRTLESSALKVLDTAGKKIEDVTWFIPHQANMRIISATATRLGVPMEKVLVNIEKFGNTSAATIPSALDEAIDQGKVKRGDLLLLDAFGAGLTYGAVLLEY